MGKYSWALKLCPVVIVTRHTLHLRSDIPELTIRTGGWDRQLKARPLALQRPQDLRGRVRTERPNSIPSTWNPGTLQPASLISPSLAFFVSFLHPLVPSCISSLQLALGPFHSLQTLLSHPDWIMTLLGSTRSGALARLYFLQTYRQTPLPPVPQYASECQTSGQPRVPRLPCNCLLLPTRLLTLQRITSK